MSALGAIFHVARGDTVPGQVARTIPRSGRGRAMTMAGMAAAGGAAPMMTSLAPTFLAAPSVIA
jgi:hypothetical protein